MFSDSNRLGMLCFVVSEAMFFLLLVIAYGYYYAAARRQGLNPGATLDVLKTTVFTVFLLSSSVTAAIAGRHAHPGGDRRKLGLWLLATIVLGVIFLAGQAMEYAELFHRGVTMSASTFGSSFFTLTGFHGFHVFLGLLMLAVLFGFTVFGRSSEPTYSAFESVALYWHFVDGVWIVVFSVVYLWALL